MPHVFKKPNFNSNRPWINFTHADWTAAQSTETVCGAAMQYIDLGSADTLPAAFFPSPPALHQPTLAELRHLANKGRIVTTDDGVTHQGVFNHKGGIPRRTDGLLQDELIRITKFAAGYGPTIQPLLSGRAPKLAPQHHRMLMTPSSR